MVLTLLGLNLTSESMTILTLPYASSKNWLGDMIVSYLTLNAVLKKTQFTSTQVSGLCSAWESALRKKRQWYWARMQLTVPKLDVHSGGSYRQLNLLLTTANLTWRDFETWSVRKNYGLTPCSLPTALTNVLDIMASRR